MSELFSYELNENGYTITELNNKDLSKIILPDLYNNKPITKIGKDCFKNNKTIREIIISNNVQEIENCAFEGCENLNKVILSSNLKKISMGLFNYSGITEIVIPDSVVEIKSIAFYRCTKLKTVTFSKNLKSIGRQAFSYCESLNTLINLEYCERIEKEAFRYCESLDRVLFVGETKKFIGDYAFADCPNIKEADISCDLKDINDTMFHKNTKIYILFSFIDEFNEECYDLPVKIIYLGSIKCPCGKGIVRINHSKYINSYEIRYVCDCDECSSKYVIKYCLNKETDDADAYYVLNKYRYNEYGVDVKYINILPENSILIKKGINKFYKETLSLYNKNK